MSTMRTLQRLIFHWAQNTFGKVAANPVERAIRLVEESIECAQATDASADVLHKIIDRVYSRPVGKIGQEIGGTALCLMSLAESLGYDVEAEIDREVTRIVSISIEELRKKHQDKVAVGTSIG